MDLEHFFDDLLEVREKTLKVDMDANAIDNLVRDLPDLDKDTAAGVFFDCMGHFLGVVRMTDHGLVPAVDVHNGIAEKALALGAASVVVVRWFALVDDPRPDEDDLDFARGVGSAVGTLGIVLEDVMLAGAKAYHSFRDEGTM